MSQEVVEVTEEGASVKAVIEDIEVTNAPPWAEAELAATFEGPLDKEIVLQ